MSSIATTRSRRTQVTALFCAVIIMLATTVEIAHGHVGAAPSSGPVASRSSAAAQPGADCTICFAAHSPAAIFVATQVVAKTIALVLVPVTEPAHLTRTFHFSLFVRPPPLV